MKGWIRMKVESMDANSRINEYSADKVLAGNISQKKIATSTEGKDLREEGNLLLAPEKMIIDTIEKANKVMTVANRSLEFSMHEVTKEIMVKVINTETKEVIREIPSEKILDLVASLMEIAGLLVDERR